jgi:2-C-methyl-D-erythritol 4-phosphate cytidylyltransferase/2-C-methyl-D-erythritol 2,4-cyclodiphosphate synthase
MNSAIILIAGSGTRLGAKYNKVFLPMGFKKVIDYTIASMITAEFIDQIVLVYAPRDQQQVEQLLIDYQAQKPVFKVIGGLTRQDSVYNGLMFIKNISDNPQNDWVFIHNGCNPLVSHDELMKLKQAMQDGYDAATLAFPEKDTLRTYVNGKLISLARENIWHMQTPQVMSLSLALNAHTLAQKMNMQATDDIELLSSISSKIKLVQCSEKNFKITFPNDLTIANSIVLPGVSMVGIGEDFHQYERIKKGLYLGGIFIEDAKATIAHSDGDVILHALYNALSSAIGEGSIGDIFSDKDPKNKDVSSAYFIQNLLLKINQMFLSVKNISVSIMATEPKISKVAPLIKKELSNILSLAEERIGITASTGEGIIHEGLGIYVMVIVGLGAL